MHRRLRWGNVIRALAAAGVVACVVVWPRLAPREPVVAGGEVVPLVVDVPRGEVGRTPHRGRARGGVAGRGQRRRVAGRTPHRRRARKEAPPREAPVAGGEPAVAPRDEATGAPRDEPVLAPRAEPAPGGAPPADPAQAEFGFEQAGN